MTKLFDIYGETTPLLVNRYELIAMLDIKYLSFMIDNQYGFFNKNISDRINKEYHKYIKIIIRRSAQIYPLLG